MDNHKDMPLDKIYEAVKGESSVYMRMIWNAAIEKAAEIGEQDHGSYCEEIGNEIRKLKV